MSVPDAVTVRTVPGVLGAGAALAVVQAVFDYTGGSLGGYKMDPDVDEFERRQELRKNRRRPIQETLDQIGEGRGIQTLYESHLYQIDNFHYDRNIWPRLR